MGRTARFYAERRSTAVLRSIAEEKVQSHSQESDGFARRPDSSDHSGHSDGDHCGADQAGLPRVGVLPTGTRDHLWKEVPHEEGVKGNPSEYKSVARPQQRDTFFEVLDKLSFDEMAKKYAADRKVPFKRRVVNKIKRTIKKILRGGGGTEKQSNANYGILFTFKK